MGTLKDTVDAAIAADNWCTRGAAIIETRSDAPDTWYDECDTAAGFLQILNMTNPAKATALFLESLLELVSAMPASDCKTRLDTIGNETANLADQRAWFTSNPDDMSECKNLVEKASAYLDGTGNSITMWNTIHVFCRAQGEVDKVGYLESGAALLTLWKSRCTKAEWANSLT